MKETMTQDKSLREAIKQIAELFSDYDLENQTFMRLQLEKILADFFINKIRTTVEGMKKEPKFIAEDPELFIHWKEVGEIDGYNQFGDDLLEALGIDK